MSKIFGFVLNGERYQAIAIFFIVTFAVLFLSCESTVNSIVEPSHKVTRQELQNEVDFYLAQAKIRFEKLDKAEEFKKAILDNAIIYTQSGTINPVGLLTTFAGIFGIGAAVDNVRKRKLLKNINVTYEKETEP